jgi:hypothetical protein
LKFTALPTVLCTAIDIHDRMLRHVGCAHIAQFWGGNDANKKGTSREAPFVIVQRRRSR